MIAIATLKEEQGVLGAYIRVNGEVSKFIPGSKYFGIALNTQMLTEAILAVYPGALFVDSKTFDAWEDNIEGTWEEVFQRNEQAERLLEEWNRQWPAKSVAHGKEIEKLLIEIRSLGYDIEAKTPTSPWTLVPVEKEQQA